MSPRILIYIDIYRIYDISPFLFIRDGKLKMKLNFMCDFAYDGMCV